MNKWTLSNGEEVTIGDTLIFKPLNNDDGREVFSSRGIVFLITRIGHDEVNDKVPFIVSQGVLSGNSTIFSVDYSTGALEGPWRGPSFFIKVPKEIVGNRKAMILHAKLNGIDIDEVEE